MRNSKVFLSCIAVTLLCCALLWRAEADSRAQPHCFDTNGVMVCHDPRDESIFYNTPRNEVAYAVQTIHDRGNYYTIYHSQPKGDAIRNGDSISAGVSHGAYTFRMPPHAYRIWGPDNDPRSLLDSDGIGGGGNPMAISGLAGDPYFYVFFLGVTDDNRRRDHAAADWRHYLLEARTKDFVSFDLKTQQGWVPFADTVEPAALKDTRGDIIRSNTGRTIDKTQGLIGSISFVNGAYHYFYVDYSPDGSSINLYHRTSQDVSTGSWSLPEVVLQVSGFAMIRLAKAKDMNRWVIMYGCFSGNLQDFCIQYTKALDVFGPTGIDSLHLTSDYGLGFARPDARTYAQPYWLTNRWGNLDTVDTDNGGEMYWTDMTPSDCNAHPYPHCPVYGGKVYRAGWTVSVPPGQH